MTVWRCLITSDETLEEGLFVAHTLYAHMSTTKLQCTGISEGSGVEPQLYRRSFIWHGRDGDLGSNDHSSTQELKSRNKKGKAALFWQRALNIKWETAQFPYYRAEPCMMICRFLRLFLGLPGNWVKCTSKPALVPSLDMIWHSHWRKPQA